MANQTTPAIQIKDSNVGIGTTSPTRKLQITDGEVYVRFNPTAVAGNYILGAADGRFYVIPEATFVPTMTFNSGNVLIGTTTDNGQKLRVYGGTLSVEGTQTGFFIAPNYAGSGDIPAGTLISPGGTNSNIGIIADGSGIAGSKVAGVAYNGSAWRSMWEFANVSSGEPILSLVRSAGSVGIGTTAPAQKFEVYGDEGQPATSGTTQNGMVRFRPGSTEGWGESLDFGMHIGISGPASYAWLQATNAGNLGLNYNFSLNPNGGNVGIGTASPSGKLSVDGGSFRFNWANPATANYVWINRASGQDGGILLTKDQTLDWQINNSGAASNLDFYAYGASATAMSLTRATANVLIGTTTDSGYKLRVNGTAMIDSSLRLVGNMTVGGDTSQWSLAGVANGGAIWQKSNSGAGGSDDRYLRLGNVDNNGTPNYVLTIFNSNVGINTTNPANQLQIGSMGSTGYAGNHLTIGDGTSVFAVYMASNLTNLYTNKAFSFQASGSGATGNVLINTTTDSGFKLDVNGITRLNGNAYTTGENGIEFIWSGNTLNDSRIGRIRPISTPSQNPYAGGLAFDYYKYDGSTYTWFEGMRLAGSGNVGIGTNNPEQKLHVQGSGLMATLQNSSTAADGYTQLEFKAGDRYGYIWLGNQNATSWAGAGGLNIYTSNGNMDLWTGAAQRIRIMNAGNVLIGTTTDAGYKLDVNGTFRSQGTAYFSGNVNFSNQYRTYGLPYFEMGGGGISDEYLLLVPKYVSGTVDPYLLMGELQFQRGSTSTGNDNSITTINIQTAYNQTNFYQFSINGATVWTSIDIISVSGVQWYALKARTNGGGPYLVNQFVGNLTDSGSQMLTRVRLSDAGVSLVTANVFLPSYTNYGNYIVRGTSFDSPYFALQGDQYTLVEMADRTSGATDVGFIGIYNENTKVIDIPGNSDKVYFNNGGNFLIGTTTDSGYKLAVAGNAVLGYAQNRPVFYDSGGGNFQIKASAGGWATGYFFQGSSGTFLGGWGGFGGNDALGYLWAGDAYNTPTMVVYGAQGNVGIGTTEPSNKLTVTRSAATAGQEVTYGLRVVQGKPITIGGDNDYAYIQSWSSGPLSINAQGNNVLFPNANTNVGLGTTSPDAKLDVVGVIRYGNDGASIGALSYGSSGVVTLEASSANTSISFLPSGTGNVGIGTLTPNSYLSGTKGLSIYADANPAVGFANTSSYWLWYMAGSTLRMWNSTANELLTGHTSGNITIGTTTDAGYKLDVNGTGYFRNVLRAAAANTFPIRAIATNGDVSRISFEDPVNTSNDAVWVGSEGYNLCFGSSYNEQARISSSGNLIIGSTTDAGYKLDVHGEILGRDDIRITNTYAIILNGTDANWRIGRNTITDSGWLTNNTMQMVVFGGQTGQGFQVVNTNGTALFEIDGVAGASRFTNALGVGVNPSGTAGRIDASNDIVAFSTSDQRLKENITPIANALDKVKSLTGVEFDWKEETKDVHGYEGHDVGVIAQEVQAVLPEAVRTNDSGYLSVRYEKMIALLVEANKELAARVEELEKKLGQ